MQRICVVCRAQFEPTYGQARSCSQKCKDERRREKDRSRPRDWSSRKTLTCAGPCGKSLFNTRTSLPQGRAMCNNCRKSRPKPLCAMPDCPKPAKGFTAASLCGAHEWNKRYGRRLTQAVWKCTGCGAETSGGNGNSRFCPDCKEVKRAAHRRTRGHRKRARLYGVHYEYVNPTSIHERDRWRCGLCQRPVDKGLVHPHPKSVSLDHVLPISLGGDHAPANLQCAHLDCNVAKSNRGAPQQLALIG